MYKNTYGYMYFYTFFNNNTMRLIVLLLKIKKLNKKQVLFKQMQKSIDKTVLTNVRTMNKGRNL